MGQRWSDYESAADHGPLRIGYKIFFALIAFFIIAGTVSYGLGWIGDTAQVAKEEFGPRAALAKYEWFKDAASQLEKKKADIVVYDGRLKALEESYTGSKRSEWPRDDREQHSTWSAEVAGVKASYNSLAADYNAQMAKFNWAFANRGDLPKGADEPLPREFKTYITN